MVKAQTPQGALQAPGHQPGGARVGLNHQHKLVALRSQAFQSVTEQCGPAASPINVVHAALEGPLQSVAGNSITGADSQAPHLQTGTPQHPPLEVVKLCIYDLTLWRVSDDKFSGPRDSFREMEPLIRAPPCS